MTEIIESPNNPGSLCRLAHYREAMAAAGHASPSQLPGRDMDGDQPRDSIPAVEATPPALGDVTTAIIPRHEPFSIPPVTEEPDEISGSGAGFSCEMGGINEAEHDCSAKGSCRPRRSSTHHSIISRRQSTANSLRQQSTSSGVDSQAPDVEADDSSVDTGALNHEQKLKKLRRQDLDDYEEQLLDCIVNIGKQPGIFARTRAATDLRPKMLFAQTMRTSSSIAT